MKKLFALLMALVFMAYAGSTLAEDVDLAGLSDDEMIFPGSWSGYERP